MLTEVVLGSSDHALQPGAPEGMLRQGTALQLLQVLLQHTPGSAQAGFASSSSSRGQCLLSLRFGSALSSCMEQACTPALEAMARAGHAQGQAGLLQNDDDVHTRLAERTGVAACADALLSGLCTAVLAPSVRTGTALLKAAEELAEHLAGRAQHRGYASAVQQPFLQ
jgi:hypothetical protein